MGVLSSRKLCFVALGVALGTVSLGAGPTAAGAQGLFGSIVDQVKSKVRDKVNDAVNQVPAPPAVPQPKNPPQYTPDVVSDTVAGAAEPLPASATAIPVGVPGGADLKTRLFSWSDALPTHGNAGLPEYARANINNTPARQKWIDTFDSWIRKTYTPLGGVPQPFRNIYPDKVDYKDYFPIAYGMEEVMQDPAIKNGKVTRSAIPSLSHIFITANGLYGMEPAWTFNTPSQFAFTMTVDRDGRELNPQERAKQAALLADVHRRIGIDATVYMTAGYVNVLLTRDGRLPIRQLTIGEALDIADPGIRRQQAYEPRPPEVYAERLAGVQDMRARHAGELNAPAWVREFQYLDQSFSTSYDVFGPDEHGLKWPVYRFEPETYAAAKTDTPQWIIIAFPVVRENASARDRGIYAAMVDHFNYAYVRDLLFNPERVKGVAYTPR